MPTPHQEPTIATAQQVCPEGNGSPAGTWWNGRCQWGQWEPCGDGVEWSLLVGPVVEWSLLVGPVVEWSLL
eukprot:3314705-Rhodomonas_salina.1